MQTDPSEFGVLRKQKSECEEVKAIKTCGEKYQRGDSCTRENSRGLQRGCLVYLIEF